MPRVSDRIARIAALLIATLAAGITIRTNTYVAWGTDSSAYLDAAAQWVSGDLFHPTNFQLWAPWSADAIVETPFGRTPGRESGTIVTVYPMGYGVLLGAAVSIAGPLAAHVVSPLLLGVLAWCAYLLASRVTTPWAGVGAALLTATTPVAVAHVLMPMSDVPAAAFWAMAWVLALRPGLTASLACGLCVAMAALIRPNLAPLAVVIAATLMASQWGRRDRTFVRLVVFGMAAAVGPVLLLWSQDVLYGSPFTSGYRDAARQFFSRDRIPANAVHYPRLLFELYDWPVFLGLALVPFAFTLRPRHADEVRPSVVVLAAFGIVLVNFGVMLPYLTFEGWFWLRFMLPALVAMFVLLAAAMDRVRQLIAMRSRVLQWVALVPLVLALRAPRHEIFATFENLTGYPRVSMMGRYLREALPPNAVILTYLQSGAASFYTGYPIVRLDAVAPNLFDRIIDDLLETGRRPFFVVDEAMEGHSFRERWIGSPYRMLDWPARAEFWSVSPMLVFDPLDRERFLNGEAYPTDILRTPIDYPYPASAASLTPRQGVAMPRQDEAVAFRRSLDAIYRDLLGRAAGDGFVAPELAVRYTIRYLRYRIYACAHEDAIARVFTQIDTRDVPPVCGRIDTVAFPPRDQTVDFRRKLEAKFRDQRHARPSAVHVDLEGDAIWTQEYLRYRLESCDAAEATARVQDQIQGKPPRPPC